MKEKFDKEPNLRNEVSNDTWLALIVTLADGSEVCPWLILVDELDQKTPMAETFHASQYHLDLVQKNNGVDHRFENVTQGEIYDRGYREPPVL